MSGAKAFLVCYVYALTMPESLMPIVGGYSEAREHPAMAIYLKD